MFYSFDTHKFTLDLFDRMERRQRDLWSWTNLDAPVYFDSDKSELTFDLPGLGKEDVELSLADGILTLKTEGKNVQTLKISKGYKVGKAAMKNGRLTVKLEEDRSGVQKIEVE